MQRGEDFVVGWIERDGAESHLVLAEGVPQEPGADPAHMWTTRHVESVPWIDASTEPKYLTMALSTEGALFGFTEGNPDVQGRVFGESGELAMSPLRSGLEQWLPGTYEKSSDVALDAAGDFAVVVWEENWTLMGPGQDANLVFSTSTDGGNTWSPAKHLLDSSPTPGGDPSVFCTADGTTYLAFQKPEPVNLGGIYAARRLPGEEYFSLIDAPGMDTLGRIGSGWLAAIDGLPDRFAVAWEQTDGEYIHKSEHRVAVAFVADANTNPEVTYGPITESPPEDDTSYDLAANVSLAADGDRVDVFWAHLDDDEAPGLNLKLMHRVDLASEGTSSKP